jgi:glycosyltransferase involved in cell wall biosynthesis
VRVGINALAVSPERPGGDVSYVIELVRRLPGLDLESEWVIFIAPSTRQLFPDLPSNARYVVCPVPGRSPVIRVLWEQIALVPLAAGARLDVLFAPVNVLPLTYPGRTLLTLHEAEPFMPDSRIPLPLLAWWRSVRYLSARRADRIITVSHAARDELVRWMRLPRRRLQVVHLGVDLDRFAAHIGAHPPPLDGAPYILWVGRPYPRKNLDALLSAYSALREAGRPERLVLIGPRGWQEAALLRRIQAARGLESLADLVRRRVGVRVSVDSGDVRAAHAGSHGVRDTRRCG